MPNAFVNGAIKLTGRQLSREVDKVRKRYVREAARYGKVAENATGYDREKALARKARAEATIEKLRYDKGKRSYSDFVINELARIEFQSRAEQRVARARLDASGKTSKFYAITKDLWQGREGASEDQRIITSLNDIGYEVTNLNEAIDVIDEITGEDFDAPDDIRNEWEKYDSMSALMGAFNIASKL